MCRLRMVEEYNSGHNTYGSPKIHIEDNVAVLFKQNYY